MSTKDLRDSAIEKAALILRHLRGEASHEEQARLQQWIQEDEANRAFMEALENDDSFRREYEFFSSINVNSAWREMRAQTVAKKRNTAWMRYAASVALLILSSVALYNFLEGNRKNFQQTTFQSTDYDIAPGGDKAILELSDGSTIVLEEAENGVVKSINGAHINKEDNTLIYDKATPERRSPEIAYNKVSTPTGGQFRIVLPDGTKVWLNAQSSLRYPTAFAGNARVVEMTGEAYFEVAHNAQMPFEVRVGDVTVKVLGTHFNVMAYANEPTINTTLLEGSVRVVNGTDSKTISPGQQARVAQSIEVSEASSEEVVAWKNGYFQFRNTSLEMILRQLERWYGAEFVSNPVPSLHFTGSISRNNNISEILNLLELTGGIQFTIGTDKRIVVTSVSTDNRDQ